MRWTHEEDELIRAGKRVPGRTIKACQARRFRLGACKPKPQPWTAEEDAAIRADPYGKIPGRTPKAVESRRSTLGIQNRGSGGKWSPEHIAMLHEDPYRRIPGKSEKGMYMARRRYGLITHPGGYARGDWWRPEEKTLIMQGKPVPGRSEGAQEHMRLRLGVKKAKQVFECMSRFDPQGYTEAATKAIPRHVHPQAREELIQDLVLAMLEGKADKNDLRAYLKKVRRDYYKLFPVFGAPISLDTPRFDDGRPLHEIVSQGMWQ